MPNNYQGMRWYKCDLHVHTPEDANHWQDSSLRLKNPRIENDLQEQARLFLKQCYQLGLECIAVTDHNFSSETDERKWFLTHLIEQNNTVAKEIDKSPLIIFPGFELDIRYHVLCLFEPVKKGKDLQSLSEILTTMNLPAKNRFINGKPQQFRKDGGCWSLRELLGKVQNKSGGIVIAAHAFSNDGICNDPTNIPDYINNPDLYAVEVSKWPLEGKMRDILEGSNAEWKRPIPHRPPAYIRSSDAKKLKNSVDTGKEANVLGNRFTWIKMSRPSIESLRQAFLDPNSRICLETEPPTSDHTYISYISIKGTKFLADQTIYFSPHLNCIIGGRGSGKSMLFESLRRGLRGDEIINLTGNSLHAAKRQVNRLLSTFTESTEIELNVSRAGLEDRFLVMKNEKSQIIGREVDDEPTVFRLLNPLIFSQEEITELTDKQEILLEFIDNLVRERLEKERQDANTIVDQIKAARELKQTLNRLNKELNVLEQEVNELNRQLENRDHVQEDLKKHRVAQGAYRYLQSLIKRAEEVEKNINTLAEELENEPPSLGSRIEIFPEKTFFSQLEKNISDAYRKLAEAIHAAGRDFGETFRQSTLNHQDWKKIHDAINQAEEQFNASCREKGLKPDEADKIREIELQFRSKSANL
ncbi:MAG: AAA family ATPase, partial [Acidobacteria bacterium]|nr:AAA family ATPase [Acidobacteriota bacterium]